MTDTANPFAISIKDYPPTISFPRQSTVFLKFSPDGTVWANPDLKPDEIAAKVIECIKAQWPEACHE